MKYEISKATAPAMPDLREHRDRYLFHKDMRDKILSRGTTGDLMQMFSDFTGMQQPDASSLLKARGL